MSLPSSLTDHILAQFEVFSASNDEKRARDVVSGGREIHVEPGERVLDEGDPSENVYILLEGTVGVFYSAPKGTNVLVKVFGPPALFGEMELPTQMPRMEYVEVFDAAHLVALDGAGFLEFLRSDAGSSFAMFEDVAARLCISAYNERALAFLDVETRTAGLFLSLLDVHPSRGTTAVIPFRLTYPMIARCLGATEKSVERTIGRWLSESWLERDKGHYRIVDVDALKAKADEDLVLLHSQLGRPPRRGGD